MPIALPHAPLNDSGSLPGNGEPVRPRRVLKPSAAAAVGTPIAFNLVDLRRTAETHSATARGEAESLLQTARQEAIQVRDEARRQGHREGYAAGRLAAEQEVASRVTQLAADRLAEQLRTALPAWQAALAAWERLRTEGVSVWEARGVRLALAIAERVLHRQLAAHPGAMVPMMAEALRMMDGAAGVTVRLHPDDFRVLDHQQILTTASRSEGTRFLPDDSLARGDAVVESSRGTIDARVATLLDRLADELLQGNIAREEDA